MNEELRPITRAELEKERIDKIPEAFIFCDFRGKCTRAGQYTRCYSHLDALCPFYVSYHHQRKLQERRFDAEG